MIYSAPDSTTCFQNLVNAICASELSLALEELKNFKDVTRIDDLVKVLQKNQHPVIWLAAFENEFLTTEMDSRHLLILIPALLNMRFNNRLDPRAFEICNTIFEIILRHRAWCQQLSYSYFITLIPNNASIASTICGDPGYIRMLEASHLLKIINYYPNGAEQILRALEHYLCSQDSLDVLWAEESIAYLRGKSSLINKTAQTSNHLATLRKKCDIEATSTTDTTLGADGVRGEFPALKNLSRAIFDLEMLKKYQEIGDDDEQDVEPNDKFYQKGSAVVRHLSGCSSLQDLDDDLEEAEDHEVEPEQPRGLRRTKSFYIK